MISFVGANIHFNEEVAIDIIRNYLIQALDAVSDRLLDIMQQEVATSVSAGRTAWQDEMYDDLKEVCREVTDDFLSVKVGLDYKAGSHMEMRAFVMTYGSGSKGTPPGEPIHAGP